MYRTFVASLIFIQSVACSHTPQTPVAEVSRSARAAPTPQQPSEETEPASAPNSQEIHAAVGRKSDEIRQCYMLGTFRDSQLEGTVNVLFTIESSGRVSETSDGGSDMPDQQVVACVLDVFAHLEFRAGGYYPTQVQFPISFGKS